MSEGPKQRLTRLLRSADPAADGAAPTPVETAELRRRVLRSVRTSRPLPWIPIAVASSLLLLLVVGLLFEGPARRSETAVQPGAGSDLATDRPLHRPDSTAPVAASADDDARPTEGARPAAQPVTPAADDVRPADGVRQVQFATEGGTRVIWVLNPELAL